ncbi:MAG: Wzz/FepE/Etk N-terminal domain-containing protein [Gammaproteobacteria bacterium]|nr:Wzz/FepE/Etk N-terminal domain-containing protein [Gammaproteobacteria bacterium]
MEENTKDLQGYMAALRKRKSSILLISISVFVLALAVAMLLPSVYRSSATILIEQQEIPQELVMSTVTSYAAERIRTIEARVMSRTNLFKIIEKFNLYEKDREFKTSEEIVENMREDTVLEVISAEVMDPRTGRASVATIAFTLSYEGESPAKVQRVASELTTLYLNENLRNRTSKAKETSSFFDEETTRLGKQISDLERKLAIFKENNADLLPELQQLNMQILQRTETDITSTEAQLQNLEERKFYLEGQLAQIQPSNPLVQGASAQLAVREAEYAAARSRYSEEHPDLLRLKNEIASLRLQTGTTGSVKDIANELVGLKAELAQTREKYTPEHPDVMALESKISSLEAELKTRQQDDAENLNTVDPDNPAYLTMRSQLESVNSEIRATMGKLQSFKDKLASIEERLRLAPQAEREYLGLKRDYENAVVRYQETKAKQMQADVARQLETESKGERFTLIDPPALPEEPVSPNRPAILFLGFILSLGSGIGFAVVADAISGAVHGARGVKMVLGVLPLSVIPYQMNARDVSKRRKTRLFLIIGTVLAFFVALIIVHFAISPLDVLWFRVMRKGEMLAS